MRSFGTPAVVLTLGLSIGCGGGDDIVDPPPPSTLDVTTGSAPPPRFIPSAGTVAAGGEITFTNGSPVAHDVTTGSDAWTAATLQPGESFVVTLDEPGLYSYQCTIHPGMTGTISVE